MVSVYLSRAQSWEGAFWECGGLPPLFFRAELDPYVSARLWLNCSFKMKPASYH